jgi:amino acid adenylation domain-containing protein
MAPVENMMVPLPWADRQPVDFEVSLPAAFDEAANAYPSRIAVDTGGQRVSYRQLQAAAHRLALQLIEAGCTPADRVAILMAHDAAAIAAVVGAAKAGCVILGLNCTDPAARLRQLAEDAEPAAIVADVANRDLASEVAGERAKVVVFDLGDTERPSSPLPDTAGGARTAALVYTSGTAGRPKGVMKTHRQICRNVSAHSQAMRYSSEDRIPLFSSIGTGQGTTVTWCALLNGATLCPFSIRTKGFAGLEKWMEDVRLTVFVSSASILRNLVKSLGEGVMFSGIDRVRLASESVTADDVRLMRRHFPPDCVFVHTLSSSETGNIAWARWSAEEAVPNSLLPVGNVSRDIEVLLLGDDDQPVEPGDTGEIAVRSRYTAAGYWRDPSLTAERFSPELDGSGTRLVRNGDLARLDAEGRLEFRGRKDSRIKIRGNRIELSDVEWALRKVPGIEHSAVVALPREGGEPVLVAFVVPSPDTSLSSRQLRHLAAASMPLQMLPSRFVFLDGLPLGAGGKVDRNLLRGYELPRHAAGDSPRGSTETAVADIWAEALDLPDVGRDDDFFEAGGDSLRGAVVAAHLHAAFGLELSLSDLASNPTVAALAAHVDAAISSPAEPLPPIVRVPRTAPLPLSPYQERIWRALDIMQRHTVLVRSYQISGPLDRKAMERAFDFLVQRHEMFRTTFSMVDGEPMQTVHPSAPSGFAFIDVSGEADPVAAAERICAGEAEKRIDASALPTMRLLLIRLSAGEHWLLRVGHVLGQDASSFAMVMHEFAALYDADVRGLPPPLSKDMPLQYADFAVWHREIMRPEGPAYRQALDWWKRVFAKRLRTTRLPFREHRAPAREIAHATHRWELDADVAERLDAVARRSGATHFTIRLACFLALLAHASGRSVVAIGTSFTSRQRSDTSRIAGIFTNLAPLVMPYRRDLRLSDWIRAVRDRVFETEKHADLPLESLYASLRRSGLRLPPLKVMFTMASDWSEQQVGGITIRRRPHPLPEMPWGFQMYVDQRTPTHCRIEFDASRYRPEDVRSFTASYVRLLEAAACDPGLSIGELVTTAQGKTFRGLTAWFRRALHGNR